MQMELLFVLLLEDLELLVKLFVPGVQDSSLETQSRDGDGKVEVGKPQASGGTEDHVLNEVYDRWSFGDKIGESGRCEGEEGKSDGFLRKDCTGKATKRKATEIDWPRWVKERIGKRRG